MSGPDQEVPHTNLPAFHLQLVDAYLYHASVARVSNPSANTTDPPTLEVRPESASTQEDDRVLVVVIGAKVGVAFREGHRLEIDCATAGHFRSERPITEAEGREFTENSALVLIYPYLRAHVGELGRMSGIHVPPLPTLDVSASLTAIREVRSPSPSARPQRRRTKRSAEASAKE
jgi:preprotein translocase subunit SecB